MEGTGQFSIYKVDLEKVEGFVEQNRADYLEKVRDWLLDQISKNIKRKTEFIRNLSKEKYKGYFFQTKNRPVWDRLIFPILVEDIGLSADSFQNTNVSYILTYLTEQNIYIMTAGYGSHYVKDYIEVSFGLNLLPKLLDENKSVLREVSHAGMTGNRLTSSYTNKAKTNFALEKDMRNIYKQLIAEIDTTELYNLGLLPTPKGRKSTSLMSTDSLVIRRSISLNELQEILIRLDQIQQRPSRFVLNYFEELRSDVAEQEVLWKNLITSFINKDLSAFIIVGKDYLEYIEKGKKYILIDKNGDVFLERHKPLTVVDIYDELENRQMEISKKLIREIFFKWKLSVVDENGNYIILSLPLKTCLQGEVTNDNGEPCYLFDGKWYIFAKNAIKVLTDEFVEYYIAKEDRVNQLKEDYNLYCGQRTETEYNEFLRKNNKIIVSHLVRIGNIEIADAIFWDEHNLYLLHNKDKFQNDGIREVSGQIKTSAHILQMLKQSTEGRKVLQQYYEKIMKRYPELEEKITCEKFIDLFFNKKICYIAGYISSYRKSSGSTYGKYVTVSLNKELLEYGNELLSMNLV